MARLGPFRWDAVAPWRAGRTTFGVVLPLAVGLATGHLEFGSYMALGALPAGVVSFQGETLSRVGAIATASLGMAFSTFVGATTAAAMPWLLVPIAAIWGYATGISMALGQRQSTAVLQWSVALMIAVGLPLGGADAAARSGFVLAGGLFQAVLVALTWMVRPGGRERGMLAASYGALAEYASRLAAGGSGPPPASAFPAGSVLADPNPLLPRPARLALLDLLEEAERIRGSLAALAAEDRPGVANETKPLLTETGQVLRLVAEAIRAGGATQVALVRELRRRVAGASVASSVPWRWAGEALLGQLRAVGRIIGRLAAMPEQLVANGTATTRYLVRGQGDVARTVRVLRANASLASEAGRHALRLAVTAGLAEAIAQASGLYQGRWITLTIFFVLKPDYASTFSRGLQRAAGTMLGAGVAGTLAHFANLGQPGVVGTAGFWIALAYAMLNVNYLVFSVGLTAFIVELLDLLGMPAIQTAEARLIDTVIGSALGLAAYSVWPSWGGRTAQETFAQLVEAHRAYGTALLRALTEPAGLDARHLRAVQDAARRARSEAEAATARLAEEPAHPPLTADLARASLAAVTRLAHAELALHALVLQGEEEGRLDVPSEAATPLEALGTAYPLAMQRLAVAFRSLQPPEPIPPLRPIQTALRDEPAARESAVARITDRLVDAVDTLDTVLRDRLRV